MQTTPFASGTDGIRDATAGGSHRPLRVLIVDDDEMLRKAVRDHLRGSGYDVLEAEHGADALRVAEQESSAIDVVLTDVYMPGLRGSEMAERIRAIWTDVRILFMSGYDEDDLLRSGVVSASAFLRKPFTVVELTDAIARAGFGESAAA